MLHIILATAVVHDDCDGYSPNVPIPFRNTNNLTLFHCYHGTALFRQKLALLQLGSVPGWMEQDVLLAASTLLTMTSFADTSHRSIYNTWPLEQSSTDDLAWLKIGRGGSLMCRKAEVASRQSAFTYIRERLLRMPPPDGTTAINVQVLPPSFNILFPSLADSTCKNNPYHAMLSILSQLNGKLVCDETYYDIFSFFNFMQPEYYDLLVAKDLRALLLLAYWFAQIAPGNVWWFTGRSVRQGLAVCEYIKTSPSANQLMIDLISYPRKILAAIYTSDKRTAS